MSIDVISKMAPTKATFHWLFWRITSCLEYSMTEAFCVEKWDHFSISHSEYQFYHQNPTDLVILNTSNPLQDKLLTTIHTVYPTCTIHTTGHKV